MKKLLSILVLACLCMFGLFACGESKELPEDLKEATDYVKDLYENEALETSSDFTRPAIYKEVSLEWSVNVSDDKVKVISSANGKTVTIDVNEEADADINYVLKVVLKNKDGKTAELQWDHKVPKLVIMTWEQYIAAKAENKNAGTPADSVAVEGIVTAIISKSNGAGYNCLYLQDKENKGAYYAYGSETDPVTAGIQVGMTVRCTGLKDVYSGTHEIKSASYKIIDETIKTVNPVDYTELFTNAKDLKDASITAAQGLLVTLKGVTIESVTEANGYYNFKLAGKESYIRISSSVCPLSKADQTTFINNFKAHIGYTANATGVICVYSDNFYLTPVSVDAFEYLSLPVLDDAGMVAFEKEHIKLETKIEEAKSYDLAAKGSGYEAVAITWETSNDKVAKIENGKVTYILPDETTEVTLTATLTAGEVTDTVAIKVTVVAPTFNTLTSTEFAKIFELKDKESFKEKRALAGTIVTIDTAYNEGYNNITVTIKPDLATDDDHNLQCYRLKGGADLAVGDYIVVNGILKNYGGKFEFDSGCTYVKVTAGEDAAKVLTDAFALEQGKSLTGDQTVAGTIVSIDTEYSEKYNNITVTIKFDCATDDDHNVQCYRLKGGADLAVGDRIVVTGVIKNFNGTVEFDAGAKYIKLAK